MCRSTCGGEAESRSPEEPGPPFDREEPDVEGPTETVWIGEDPRRGITALERGFGQRPPAVESCDELDWNVDPSRLARLRRADPDPAGRAADRPLDVGAPAGTKSSHRNPHASPVLTPLQARTWTRWLKSEKLRSASASNRPSSFTATTRPDELLESPSHGGAGRSGCARAGDRPVLDGRIQHRSQRGEGSFDSVDHAYSPCSARRSRIC